jgi:hypothetical protein
MRFQKPLTILGITAALAVLWWSVSRDTVAPSPPKSAAAQTSYGKKTNDRTGNPLEGSFDRIKPSADTQQSLKELQEKLRSMAPVEAVVWIREFLATGKDKLTGMPFEIGDNHLLKQWPTFRTFLIDALHSIDPSAAASISREILARPTTADEWALALRNIGLTDSAAATNAELRGKTEALISNPAWQANPSVGYLNAFDVLVHTKAVESTPLLTEMVQRKDRKDLVHAAFLTLDRLVQRSPTEVLTLLASDKALQQSRPEMTAQQFARADLRDPAQQALVKSWLLDPARSANELNSFSGVYPNNNRFVSNNLLTTETAQSGAELNAHDRAALEILQTWADDPAFAPVKDSIATMIGRLNGFVANPNP